MEKIKWGILGTAKIALQQVIPGLQQGSFSEVSAICSRSLDKAQVAASSFGIKKAYGSYDALLQDPDIDVIYIPLPNSMHKEWTVKAMDAGKHVLCEKPIALTVAEAEEMIRVRDKNGVKAGEAFMVKSHPQWIDTRERVRRGEVGELRLVQGTFSYHNVDPDNIRNISELGGGGLWDIGCYPVTLSRYIFEQEPTRVVSSLEFDPVTNTDSLNSVLLEYPSGQALFSVSTQLVPFQRMHILGTAGHMEVKIPFNAPKNRPGLVAQDRGSILLDEITLHSYPVVDQYSLMGDAFSKAVMEDGEVPVSLEDALKNTRVLTAIFESASLGKWIEIN